MTCILSTKNQNAIIEDRDDMGVAVEKNLVMALVVAFGR